jgi:sugar lactone lactonase YvrE
MGLSRMPTATYGQAFQRRTRAMGIRDRPKLANGRVFVRAENGATDGLRVDVDGNLWCGWAGGEGRAGVIKSVKVKN